MIPVTLSQKLQVSGSDNTPFSYRAPGSIPPPSYQRGRSRARTHLESVKNGDELSFANTCLSKVSKKHNRARTMQSSCLSSLCDTDSAHLLKTLLADLTQPRTASIIAPSAQHRRESTTPSSDFTTHPLESYLLTTEPTRCLGNSFVNERGPTDESFSDGEDQPVAYGQLANSEQTHALDVLPWLKEAIDTVNDLESRIQELEQDCKVSYCIATDRIYP